MKKTKHNGKATDSMDLLARAMRQAFQDSVEAGLVPVRKEIGELREGVGQISKDLKTTNKNMHSQFAEQEKKIGKLLGKRT